LIKYEGIEVKKVFCAGQGFLRTVSSAISATFSLVKERKKIQLVNIHAPAAFVVAPIIKVLGFKLVLTVHDRIDLNPGYGRFGRFLLLSALTVAIRFADGIILVSGHLRELIKKHKNIPLVIARPGIKVENINESDKIRILKEMGCWEQPFALYLGRLRPGKGLEKLIANFHFVDDKKLKLIIAGSPRTPDYMDNLCTLVTGDKRIHFIGHVEGIKKNALLAETSVFVLPSESESVSITVLEAIAYGRRCIVNDIPAMHELKKLCNLSDEIMKIINYDDHDAFLNALANFLNQSSAPVPSRIESNIYTWEQTAKQTLNLYDKVL
jgi:glycosyltransferase involved in cell wall biosynthesis